MLAKEIARTAQIYFPGLQDLRFNSQRRILGAIGRPYRSEYRGIKRFQVERPQFLDIGASRGMSIAAMRTMKRDAEIVGFEANAHIAEQTNKVFRSDNGVRIMPFGLGAQEGKLTLYTPVYRGYRFDGLASLNRSTAAEWLPGRILGFNPSKLAIEETQVEIRVLDGFDLSPFLLKIYVQGYEEQVLLGARRTIEKYRPVIIAPGYNQQVGTFLQEYGYKRFGWLRNGFVLGAPPSSYVVYYLRPEHLELAQASI